MPGKRVDSSDPRRSSIHPFRSIMPHRSRSAILAALLVALPAAARAQSAADYDYENLVLSGVGVHVAQIFPTRSEPTLGLNVRADLGLLGPNVRISPGVTFWSTRFRDSEVERMEDRIEASCEAGGAPCPGVELGEVEVSDLSLDLDAHFLWATDYAIEPYAGAGVSLHLLNGRGDFIDDTFVEDLLDAIAPGFNLVGGLEVPVGENLRVLGEARGVLTGNVRYVSIGIGGAWRFPPQLQRPVMQPSTAFLAGGR
jgi:opacity protein-like surface antigen